MRGGAFHEEEDDGFGLGSVVWLLRDCRVVNDGALCVLGQHGGHGHGAETGAGATEEGAAGAFGVVVGHGVSRCRGIHWC